VAARCKPEGTAPANAALIAEKNIGRFLGAAGFQWKTFRDGLLTHLKALVAAKETLGSLVTLISSLVSSSLSAQKSRVDLTSLSQV